MLSLPASGVAYLIPDELQSHAGQWTGMMWFVHHVAPLLPMNPTAGVPPGCVVNAWLTSSLLNRSAVSAFALVGPLIAAALNRRFGMNAVGYWTGATLLVTTILFACSMHLKSQEDKSSEDSATGEMRSGQQTTSSRDNDDDDDGDAATIV